jgi:hypothetical protein
VIDITHSPEIDNATKSATEQKQAPQQNFQAIEALDDWLKKQLSPKDNADDGSPIGSIPQSNLYLLLDRDLAPEAETFIATKLPLEILTAITVDTIYEDTWPNAPIIVALGGSADTEPVAAVIEYYQQNLIPKNAAILFSASTQTSLETIQQHIASLLTANITNARVWLRWWEPRTLRGLTAALKTERLAHFLGPISNLCWYENTGKYSSLYQLTNSNKTAHKQQEIGWFTFTEAEEKRLKAFEEQRFHASLQDQYDQHLTNEGKKQGVETTAIFADYLTEARAHYIQTETSINSWFSLCEQHGLAATKAGLQAEIHNFVSNNPKLEKAEIIEEIEQLLYFTKLKL